MAATDLQLLDFRLGHTLPATQVGDTTKHMV